MRVFVLEIPMATEHLPIPDIQLPPPKPRRWRLFAAVALVSFVAGWAGALAVAYFAGPRSGSVSEDPLTGRLKTTETWLGVEYPSKIDESAVSSWADANSIPEVYAGRLGWTKLSEWGRGWFSRGFSARIDGFAIPQALFSGKISEPGVTREQLLQQYQVELVAAYSEHGSVAGVLKKWQDKTRPRKKR